MQVKVHTLAYTGVSRNTPLVSAIPRALQYGDSKEAQLERWGSWGTGKAQTPEKGIQKDRLSQAILTQQKKKSMRYSGLLTLFTVCNRAPITDHNVVWNQSTTTTVHLIVGKDNILTPCELKLEIVQELNGGKDTHTIGTLMLNLSEYVGSGTTTRRYLLDDCKFNSTLKVCATVSPICHAAVGPLSMATNKIFVVQIVGHSIAAKV